MDQEKIGRFISECRKQKKLTQVEIAEKLGVSDKSVSKWENGKCMPDLALFNPLCEILGITVNDLMSGEIVDNKNSVNILGENIVNMVSDLEIKKKKLKKKKIFLISLLVLIFIFCILGRCFYYFYETDVKYDDRVMSCYIDDNELNFAVKGQSVWNTYHTIREIDNEKIYFFHCTVSFYNNRRSNWEYSHSMARLLEGRDVLFGSWVNLDDISTIKENIKVYYTDSSINAIKRANESELKEIIKNSYLMCEKNN